MGLANTNEHHCGRMIRAQPYFLHPSVLTTLYTFHLTHTCYMPFHLTLLLLITLLIFESYKSRNSSLYVWSSPDHAVCVQLTCGALQDHSPTTWLSPTMLPFPHWARGKGQGTATRTSTLRKQKKGSNLWRGGYNRIAQKFQKSKRHLNILGARTVT